MAFPKAPRHWRKAIKIARSYVRNGKSVAVGYCLRETRQYYGVPSKYLSANDSLAAARRAGKAYRITNWSKVPRGAVVYWDSPSSEHGHVAISIGKGRVISTDWPRGRYGVVHGATLMRSWGYTVAYWSPLINDHRVWPRKKKGKHEGPKPKGLRINIYRVNKCLRDNKRISKYERRHMARVVKALRKAGFSVEGYDNHPKASLRRAIRKFQKSRRELRGDADGLLGPLTCRKLGLRSRKGGGKR